MNTENTDINDIFDYIALSEQRVSKESYEEGFREGTGEGNLEGYKFGYARGVEIGNEIGNYYGIASAHLLINKSDRVKRSLMQFIECLDRFPKSNSSDTDILSEIHNIRTHYKRIKALLKIPTDNKSVSENKDLSF